MASLRAAPSGSQLEPRLSDEKAHRSAGRLRGAENQSKNTRVRGGGATVAVWIFDCANVGASSGRGLTLAVKPAYGGQTVLLGHDDQLCVAQTNERRVWHRMVIDGHSVDEECRGARGKQSR